MTESVVSGIRISHQDRLVFPAMGLTKLDIARYYEAIGEWIVPHVRGRPLTLVHCPGGLSAPCHYLRHAAAWGPSALRRVKIAEQTKIGEYLVADSTAAVVALAQMGVLEIHTWNSTTDAIEKPNRIVWDLDPGREVSWRVIRDAAVTVRDVLRVLGLRVWLKTTGGRGLHLVAPIVAARPWSECLAFARAVAEMIERDDGRLFTTSYAKQGRERKILIDYLRNNRTNTSIAAFSTRARDGAPVSAPVDWDELGAKPRVFTVTTMVRRMARLRVDPWQEYWRSRQRVTTRAIEALRQMGRTG